jgi:SAM-dependent methyltransferase
VILPHSIRHAYERNSPDGYYALHGAAYRNPHEAAVGAALTLAVARWRLDLRDVLDLACGSGEVTLALRDLGAERTTGVDPYTGAAYRERTGQAALARDFAAVAAGALAEQRYTLIVCSFALHLVERSRLPLLAHRLSVLSPALLVLTPHKRPHLASEWGWTLCDELVEQRVRARYYLRAI